MKRAKLKLSSQTIRIIGGADMALAAGGQAGRTQGSVVVDDCIIACTQSCNQCSMYPECGGDTSSTTF